MNATGNRITDRIFVWTLETGERLYLSHTTLIADHPAEEPDFCWTDKDKKALCAGENHTFFHGDELVRIKAPMDISGLPDGTEEITVRGCEICGFWVDEEGEDVEYEPRKGFAVHRDCL